MFCCKIQPRFLFQENYLLLRRRSQNGTVPFGDNQQIGVKSFAGELQLLLKFASICEGCVVLAGTFMILAQQLIRRICKYYKCLQS